MRRWDPFNIEVVRYLQKKRHALYLEMFTSRRKSQPLCMWTQQYCKAKTKRIDVKELKQAKAITTISPTITSSVYRRVTPFNNFSTKYT